MSLILSQTVIITTEYAVKPFYHEDAKRIILWLVKSKTIYRYLDLPNEEAIENIQHDINKMFPDLNVRVTFIHSAPKLNENSMCYYIANRDLWVVVEVVE